MVGRILTICAASMAIFGTATAHAGDQKPLRAPEVDPNADWATRHMAEEHHISNFDPASFFSLHDFDGNGLWDYNEILKTYGMEDPSAKDIPQSKKDEISGTILGMIDTNRNGVVEREEFMVFCNGQRRGGSKGVLPDFGTGPGHHWDMEMEYEIHHWEKYHDENTKEEDLTHPEDIEHFKKHDEMEDEAEKVEALNKMLENMSIVEHNIPMRFRRDAASL